MVYSTFDPGAVSVAVTWYASAALLAARTGTQAAAPPRIFSCSCVFRGFAVRLRLAACSDTFPAALLVR